VENVRRLALLFGIDPFHSGGKESEATLDAFYDDPSGILVTTSYFGCGMDPEDMGAVYHYGPPATLTEYIQETGRAARSGCLARAVLFYDGRMPFYRQKAEPTLDHVAMTDYTNAFGQQPGTQCRRVLIDLHMDGTRTRICCQAEEEPCDVCSTSGAREGLSGNTYLQTSPCRDDGTRPRHTCGDSPSIDLSWTTPAVAQHTPAPSPSLGEVPTLLPLGGFLPQTPARTRAFAPPLPVSIATSSQREEVPYGEHARAGASIVQQDMERAVMRYDFQVIQRSVTERLLDVSEALSWWSRRCPVCIFSPEKAYSHRLGNCDSTTLWPVKDQGRFLEANLQVSDWSACWGCYLPMASCDSWVALPDRPNYWDPAAGPRNWTTIKQKLCTHARLLTTVYTSVTRHVPEVMTAVMGRMSAVVTPEDLRGPHPAKMYLQKKVAQNGRTDMAYIAVEFIELT